MVIGMAKKLQIVSNGVISNKVTIISTNIPIVLIDFQSIECEIRSSLLEIENITKIDTLEFLGNNYDNPNENKLIVNGGLLTKNLNVDCSVEINGEIYFKEDGILKFNGWRSYELTINKNLGSMGELKIEKATGTSLNIINHGNIFSKIGKFSCMVNKFRNEEDGKIMMEYGNFQLSPKGQIINSGSLLFKDFSIKGVSFIEDFLQNGICEVEGEANFDCCMISKGETVINHLIFPQNSLIPIKLEAEQGNTAITKITGNASIIITKNGANLNTNEVDGDIDFIKSSGNQSNLTFNKIKSNSKLFFSADSGGSTCIKEGDIPESFGYSGDGNLNVSNVQGKSTLYVDKNANLEVDQMKNLSLLASENAKARISRSNLKDTFLKNKHSLIFKSKVDTIYNHGKLNAIDMDTTKIENKGEIEFWNNNSTEKMNNQGNLIFREGDHKIDNYYSSNSNIKVERSEEEEGDRGRGERLLLQDERDESSDPEVAALLRDGAAKVSIGNILGSGNIECKNQTYNQMVPTTFNTKGDTDVYLNRLPLPSELPIHSGTFTYKVNMNKNYINREFIDYGDAILQMNMNGKYSFINKKGDFNAGGLILNRSKIFENDNGHIGLQKILDVDTENFISKGKPVARENGRRVDVSFWGHHLSYYCPATYYSEDKNTEIDVFDGSINIKSKNNIENCFASMKASETITATANGNFNNIVGTIIAEGEGKSTIKAKNINNVCLPAFCRKGEGHSSGSSGGFFDHESWNINHYTHEMITQSHGSKIIAGGDLDLDGKTKVFGSKVRVGGYLSGNIDSESLFENEALIEASGASLESLNFKSNNSRIIINNNETKSKEIEERIKAIKL